MLFYPQRKPRDGPYKKTNSYTHSPSKQQIMTLILFGVQLGLHGVFVVPSLPQIWKPILFLLLGFQIFLLLFIAYDYVRLTIKDPVDPLVLMEVVPIRKEKEGVRFCRYCQRTVQATSHHCMRCNRCTEDFDHHCKYLNNCIGSRNYEYFLRLIFIFSVYCLVGLGQAVWVFVSLQNDSFLTFANAKWGALAAIILDSLLYLVVTVLVLFHCYINCVENTTTYGTMYPEDPEIIARKKKLEISPQQISTRILMSSGQSM